MLIQISPKIDTSIRALIFFLDGHVISSSINKKQYAGVIFGAPSAVYLCYSPAVSLSVYTVYSPCLSVRLYLSSNDCCINLYLGIIKMSHRSS